MSYPGPGENPGDVERGEDPDRPLGLWFDHDHVAPPKKEPGWPAMLA